MLAGGQSLLPLLKLRLAHPGRLVDIGRLAELRGVCRLDDGGLAIGALTTYADLMASDASHYGLLADALPQIGDVQVRNRGTVGGSLAHADPASDLPACLLALGATVVLRSSRGAGPCPSTASSLGPFQSALEPDELITEIRLPAPRDDAGSAYASLTQPASGYSMVGVAAVVFAAGGARHRDHGRGRAPVPGRGRRGGAGVRRRACRGGRARRGRGQRRSATSTRTSRVPARDGRGLHPSRDRSRPGAPGVVRGPAPPRRPPRRAAPRVPAGASRARPRSLLSRV